MDSNTDRPATGSRRHAPGRRARSLQGEHLWGRYTVQPVTRALWSAQTLEVYPPGTNATELLFLRAWHAWRLGGPLTAAVLLLVLHDRPFVAVGLAVTLNVVGFLVLARATRRTRPAVRTLTVTTFHGNGRPEEHGDRRLFDGSLDALTVLERAHRQDRVGRVEFELVWGDVWDAIPATPGRGVRS
ncbi:hypothetical protein LQK89_08005 [Curtobacterium sp. C1]|uniref:DUF6611 family protein n=1 Tax=Curtobacterium sp. C1 TaxID=2898151 RepID=UPI001E430765|nr:DUF6611 family protein [Curtobacterium sp. C1]UFU15620.1 hypothetical protein LQK89_08005 [Curtobacterium sp. C1]